MGSGAVTPGAAAPFAPLAAVQILARPGATGESGEPPPRAQAKVWTGAGGASAAAQPPPALSSHGSAYTATVARLAMPQSALSPATVRTNHASSMAPPFTATHPEPNAGKAHMTPRTMARDRI